MFVVGYYLKHRWHRSVSVNSVNEHHNAKSLRTLAIMLVKCRHMHLKSGSFEINEGNERKIVEWDFRDGK